MTEQEPFVWHAQAMGVRTDLAVQHGVSEIWSDDRGLRRFDGIRVRTLDDPT